MKTLIVYDSVYGNTEKVAQTIAEVLGGETKVMRAKDVSAADLTSLDLLVVGSPTQWNKPTGPVQDFIKSTPAAALKGLKAAVFDTRLQSKLVGLLGYAAGKIGDGLKKKGAVVNATAWFFVVGTTIKDGELARVAGWAKEIIPRP